MKQVREIDKFSDSSPKDQVSITAGCSRDHQDNRDTVKSILCQDREKLVEGDKWTK